MSFFFDLRRPRFQTEIRDQQNRTIVLRDALPRDAAALLAFNRQVDRETFFLTREPGEMNLSTEEERGWIDSLLKQDNSLILIALHGERIVGLLDFVGGTWARIRHTGEFGISVLEEYWGSGIGSALLEELLEWARKGGVIRKIRLRVVASNERAIALYHRKGFVAEGYHPGELCVHGEDLPLISMGLRLD